MASTTRKLVGTIARKLGFNKGAPRVWLEGNLPLRAGFTPGARYSVSTAEGQARVVLKVDEQGIRLVSAKTRADRELPVIDLNSRELLSMFEGMNAVRIILMQGEIHILPDAVEVKKRDRIKRLESARESGVVSIASVSHGMGVLSHAMHQGFNDAGLKPKLVWACEIDETYIEQAMSANDAWDVDTVALAMPLQHLAFADEFTLGQLTHPVVLEAGLPCTAASIAGRSKKGLAMAEDDEHAGHLVAAFIALIARVNPVVVQLENVKPYFSTASASILRTQLKELGYDVHERDINGGEYAIENRPRHVLVAVTQGIALDLDAMIAPPRAVARIGEILEDVALDDPSWSKMSYLVDKQVRDKAAGKGFSMQVVGPGDTSVGTLGRGYQKNRSTEGKVKHPHDPTLLRLFTPTEHAKLKGIPAHLIAGVDSKTRAHELLGQSIIWPAFRHLGSHLAKAICNGVAPRASAPSEQLSLMQPAA